MDLTSKYEPSGEVPWAVLYMVIRHKSDTAEPPEIHTTHWSLTDAETERDMLNRGDYEEDPCDWDVVPLKVHGLPPWQTYVFDHTKLDSRCPFFRAEGPESGEGLSYLLEDPPPDGTDLGPHPARMCYFPFECPCECFGPHGDCPMQHGPMLVRVAADEEKARLESRNCVDNPPPAQ